MTDRFFGCPGQYQTRLFDAAVFCDPLKRRDYEYAVDEQRVYRCKYGCWSVLARVAPPGAKGGLTALLKTIDAALRQESNYRHPVKAELSTKWVLRLIQEEVSAVLAEKKSAGEQKVVIDYARLSQIRRDAAVTREKLIVEEDLEEEPAPCEEEPAPREAEPAPDTEPDGAPEPALLSPEEARLLRCLLGREDTGWVQAEGRLLSVLVDGINEKLYDTFQDCVLDDTPQVAEDYIDDLKEMMCP